MSNVDHGAQFEQPLEIVYMAAAFVEIDPMETADLADLTPDYYERRTRANVETLAKALK